MGRARHGAGGAATPQFDYSRLPIVDDVHHQIGHMAHQIHVLLYVIEKGAGRGGSTQAPALRGVEP